MYRSQQRRLSLGKGLMLTETVAQTDASDFYIKIPQNTGHFGDVLLSQSLDSVLKKNTMKANNTEQNGKNIQKPKPYQKGQYSKCLINCTCLLLGWMTSLYGFYIWVLLSFVPNSHIDSISQ